MDIFEFIKIFAVSVIEGVTEWLPISSTGHILLFDELVKMNFSPEFKSLFSVVIQMGAILAVVVLYFEKLNPLSKQKSHYEKEKTWSLWGKVVVGCIPAGVLGVLFDDFIDKKLGGFVVIAITLILYGIIFIVYERFFSPKNKPHITEIENLDYLTALKIGGFQVLSLVPGTSRSGSTILGGLISGASRQVAAEFSFFMGVPIIFGAGLLKIVKFGFNYTSAELFYLGFSLVSTFLVSFFAIKFLMKFLKNNSFEIFGWYRIILGTTVLLYFLNF